MRGWLFFFGQFFTFCLHTVERRKALFCSSKDLVLIFIKKTIKNIKKGDYLKLENWKEKLERENTSLGRETDHH